MLTLLGVMGDPKISQQNQMEFDNFFPACENPKKMLESQHYPEWVMGNTELSVGQTLTDWFEFATEGLESQRSGRVSRFALLVSQVYNTPLSGYLLFPLKFNVVL